MNILKNCLVLVNLGIFGRLNDYKSDLKDKGCLFKAFICFLNVHERNIFVCGHCYLIFVDVLAHVVPQQTFLKKKKKTISKLIICKPNSNL